MITQQPKQLTDVEYQALVALVIEYGPEHIIDVVQDIGFGIAEDEYNDAIKEGKL